MGVEFASDLEHHPTLSTLVRISLFLVDPLMLRKVSGCVVSSRTFIAEIVAGIQVMCEMILKVVKT